MTVRPPAPERGTSGDRAVPFAPVPVATDAQARLRIAARRRHRRAQQAALRAARLSASVL